MNNAVAAVEAVLSVLEACVVPDVLDAVVPIAVVTADVAAIMSSVLNRMR